MTKTLTGADFKAVLEELHALGGEVMPLTELAFQANKALAGLDLSNVQLSVWLATQAQESGGFQYLEEIDKTGDYAPYWGRTFEQVTWKGNYTLFGAWAVRRGEIAVPSLFLDRPDRLKELHWAWLGGVWFFEHNTLWDDARRGDFQKVQTVVNGRSPFPRGWPARLAWYRAWTKVIVKPALLAVNGDRNLPTNKRLQQWVGVAMDGDVGPVTYSAIQAWLGRPTDGGLSMDDIRALQDKIGAYVDGIWGPGTTRDLQTYLNEQT